jgi:hypothetical protein
MTSHNLPVLSFIMPNGELSVPFKIPFSATNLLIGTEITFSTLPTTSNMQPAPLQNSLPTQMVTGFEMLGTTRWPAFEELAQSLQQSNPQAFVKLAQLMPNPSNPGRIMHTILFFVAAVRCGDITGWLGNKTIDTLRRTGKDNIISRLTRDFSALNRLSAEPVSQDWKAMSLPMFWNGEVHKMQVFYRKDKNDNQNGEEDTKFGTRFLFDLHLSNIGPLQLDGLHRQKKLDLIVRTEKPFSSNMQNAMRNTYINAIEQTNLKGELLFQNKAEKFIAIELPKEEIGVTA